MNCLRQANMKYKLILFDLDGTLLDTSPGIFNSVRFALKESGLPQLPDNQLSDFVGPPPKQMYMKKFGLDDKAAFEVAKKHREYGRTRAIYEAKQYPDIESTIRTLKEYGCKLGVATLKSQGIAETVLKNQDLYSYMDVVVGMNDSETMTKADNAVIVTNTKRTVSPTGIMLNVTPYALLAGLASALGALFFRRKKLS